MLFNRRDSNPRGCLSRPKKNFVGELANVHPTTLGATLLNAMLDRNPCRHQPHVGKECLTDDEKR